MSTQTNNGKDHHLIKRAKTFFATNWAINNKTAVYLITLFVTAWGVSLFVTLPKEQFPDVVIPTVYVQTVYVGNSPKDMENLVTRPIEKELKGITGVKINKITSTSLQDFSAIIVEFSTSVKTDVALQKVRDAVDKSKRDLPNDLTQEPVVQEISFSEFPIMAVNVSGDYDPVKLGDFAETLKDRLEELPMINRIDLVGSPEREIQVNVDKYKMEVAKIGFTDIEQAIQRENADISGGLLEVGEQKRTLRVNGQFKTALDLEQVIVKNINGAPIYLREIAVIRDTIREPESYARLGGKNVVTLSIIKRTGENLIEASEQINAIVRQLKQDQFPKDLDITITGDLSIKAGAAFNELVNSIVIGFILVMIVLMFFMGVTNAFFVALSVPLSMFLAFIFLPSADAFTGSTVTLNFIVLFALLFGLGIVVDDAIVVIENTHRIFTQGKGFISSEDAAKYAAGEVFVPVLAGTLTTLAPFVPLLFWPGIIGKFMVYLPVMLIFTLTASLIVAYIMNPVFAVDFMTHHESHKEPKSAIFKKPLLWVTIAIGVLLDIFGYSQDHSGYRFFGNLLLFIAALSVFNRYILHDTIEAFQNRFLPAMMNRYEKLLRWALKGWRPVWLLVATFGLLVFSFMFFGMRNVPVVLFPSGDPNNVYVYMKLPAGTDIKYTDSVTQELEKRVYKVLGMQDGKENEIVESVIANVAVGASDPNSGDRSTRPELGRIQVSFVPFEERHGQSTKPYLDAIRQEIKGIPGAEISVAQESNGPPTQSPINIEVSGENFETLTTTAVALKNYLDGKNIPGVEELKLDVDLSNPEISLRIDRERALTQGISTGQIGMEIRTALFGKEISKLKIGEDEYKIQLRNTEQQRRTLSDLLNMRITYRDFSTGQIRQVPISSVVKVDLSSTYGSIKRKNQKRVITIFSNVLVSQGYTPAGVNEQIKYAIDAFPGKPEDVSVAQTGEGEQMAETMSFLQVALVIALGLILLILVLQFNSLSKTVIVMSEIVFSVIGVLLGYAITRSTASVVMTGIGIIGLAGIVVKNGILVIEFADELRSRGLRTREALVQAGKTRIVPVLLTALAAILALIPLAVGLNINFVTLFSDWNPHIFFGGDNAVFWKPLSWTIIWGLIFAFFMTLLMVPSMYLIAERLKRPMSNFFHGRWVSFFGLLGPFFFILTGFMYGVRRLQGKPIWNGLPKTRRRTHEV
ncbi:MAG: efflux RND transporter permease subunit [Chitinophagaceae bacterium]|nr:efflux RND transporter permease subunit [Chitinophagaceae bacterium]